MRNSSGTSPSRRNAFGFKTVWFEWIKVRSRLVVLLVATLCAFVTVSGFSTSFAQAASLEEMISAVVKIKTHINPDGRTVRNLGRDREGTGIVIDADGLILTIGYIIVEAYAAEVITNDGHTVPASVVGYDHETGFGLLRTLAPLKIKPMPLGKYADVKENETVVVASGGGPDNVARATVVSKREFTANWEYVLKEALFTSPPHPTWAGAALINREGKLLGVGSLMVGDATGAKVHLPGNMFVPVDLLMPILGDLIAEGRPTGPGRPWLGLTTDEGSGRLVVNSVTAGAPADKAGIKRGDIIVGIHGETPTSLNDFYKKLWSKGEAGAVVALDVMQNNTVRRIDVKSINRLEHLRLRSTF
jgi:S1-C subfamily serine protease